MSLVFAIVGAGVSGIALSYHLLTLAQKMVLSAPIHIVLIEKERFGRGAAFGTHSSAPILNVTAQHMSVLPNNPTHFLKWIQKLYPTVVAETFVPRQWYAHYLDFLLEECQRLQITSATFEKISGEVVGLEEKESALTLLLKSGQQIEADQAILALGNFPPPHPVSAKSAFLKSRCYVHTPWTQDPATFPSTHEPVFLIGTSLTAIDKIMELHHLGHQGTIHALSRRGKFPPVGSKELQCRLLTDFYQSHEGAAPSFSPTTTLSEYQPPETLPHSIREALALLKSEMERAPTLGVDAECVVYAFFQRWSSHFFNLQEKEQQHFLRHLRFYWDHYNHQIPAESRTILDKLQMKGQLKVHRGRIQEISQDQGRARISYIPYQEETMQLIEAAQVINCIGPATKPEEINDPLVHFLLAEGLIRANRWGALLDTNMNNHVIRRDGTTSKRLYALGSLRKRLLAGKAVTVSSIAPEAEKMAQQLLSFCHNWN